MVLSKGLKDIFANESRIATGVLKNNRRTGVELSPHCAANQESPDRQLKSKRIERLQGKC
jgi:hypothetical protein